MLENQRGCMHLIEQVKSITILYHLKFRYLAYFKNWCIYNSKMQLLFYLEIVLIMIIFYVKEWGNRSINMYTLLNAWCVVNQHRMHSKLHIIGLHENLFCIYKNYTWNISTKVRQNYHKIVFLKCELSSNAKKN